MDRPGKLLAGHIGKPHGVSGEVYVVRISDDPKRFEPGRRLEHDDGRELMVETARPHRDRFLVKFAGIDTRTDAESLRGELYVPFDAARTLEQDEFWPHQLIGCEVATPSGERIGTITGVQPGPAHDILVVDTPGGERLVPTVKAIVTSVDIDARMITVDAPAGLLD
ncbi:MAG: ribosome maturation factor RimM [Actinomycetota bacterium]